MREIPFGRPALSAAEREAVATVLEGHILTHGPVCAGFEEDFQRFVGDPPESLGGGAHAVTMSSAMAALHMACHMLELGPGDEAIVPALTHVAGGHAVEWVGAKPVFVDPDPRTGNLTAAAIEAALTPRTRMISVVHFVGIPCEMDAIVALAERHGLVVLEDCAIALGARWQGVHVGLWGDAGAFSFYPVKHITAGEGGMFLSRDGDLARRTAQIRAFGVDRSHGERKKAGIYEVPELGLNYRMSELQAALGRAQLARFGEFAAGRKRNFETLAAGLRQIPDLRIIDSVAAEGENSYYCLSAVLEGRLAPRRDEFAAGLKAAGVGTSVHYPQPVPRMKYYRERYGYDPQRFPVATEIADCSIAFPVAPHIQEEDVTYMIETMKRLVEAAAR